MKNEIITCVNNTHPIYLDSFRTRRIKIGKSYKCIEQLTLTSPQYIVKEYASLAGVTIRNKVDRWGWDKPCLPKECFRIATPYEKLLFNVAFTLNAPFRKIKILLFRTINSIDRIVRYKYYKELNEEYF